MYQLGRQSGHAAQDELWSWITDGLLQIHTHLPGELSRMREMMQQYSDIPMDLADAALVAAAEALHLDTVFAIDSDFYIFRTQNGRTLLPVPGPDPDTPRARRRSAA